MAPVAHSPGPRSTRRIGRSAVPLALCVGLVLLAGCSSAKDAGGSSSVAVLPDLGQPADRAGDQATTGGGAPENLPPDAGGAPGNLPPGGTTITEQIVRTGDVSVDVDDITSTANRVSAVVSAAGGDVGSDQRYGTAKDGSADLVVRIPPDSFADILDTVSGLGEEKSRSVSAQDVTTVVADIDARVHSLQTSVDRLLALAAQATSVGDLIAIESELSARQGELESLQAQQRALADQVSLATLSVHLTATSAPDQPDNGFVASLKQGWEALLGAGRAVISFVGLIIPWLILVLVLFLLAWILIRRRHAGPAAATATVSAGETVSLPAGNEPGRPPE